MTNPTNSSQNQDFRKQIAAKHLEAQVEAHPFKELLRLPPEEVQDFFHSRVGEALLSGLEAWRQRVSEELLDKARKAPYRDAVDRMYITAGIDEACSAIISLPEKARQYMLAQKKGRESNGVAKDY